MNSTFNFTSTKLMRRASALIGASLLAAALAGCASGAPADTPGTASAGATSASEQVQQLTITDPWVKATEGEMTGAFGTITNTGDAEITIVDASASVGSMFELHETIVQSDGSSVMQEKDGGYVLPAGGELKLEPGHDHIMLMGLDAPIMPGDEVTVTLTLGDGSTFEYVAVAKEYTGGMETYAPDGSLHGGSGHGDPHSGHDHTEPSESAHE